MATSSRLERSKSVVFALSLALLACEQKAPAPESTPSAASEPPPVATSAAAAVTPSAPPPPPAPADIPAPSDVAAAPADAKKTASGLATKVLQVGTGKVKPTTNDSVKVHYSGWTTDGKMFDSSLRRNEPATFGVTQVIPGWTEGLQLMVVGEKRRMWIP